MIELTDREVVELSRLLRETFHDLGKFLAWQLGYPEDEMIKYIDEFVDKEGDMRAPGEEKQPWISASR